MGNISTAPGILLRNDSTGGSGGVGNANILNITCIAATTAYSNAALSGATVLSIVDNTTQIPLNPSQYSFAGTTITLTYSPAGGEVLTVFYTN